MKGISPTQRTLKAMREAGRLVANVEKFNPHAGPFGQKEDCFGFIDLIVIDPVQGIVAIQSCGQSYSDHVKKLTEERNEAVYEWLRHAKCELWAWRKVKLNRGGKAERWKPRVADVVLNGDEVVVVERK